MMSTLAHPILLKFQERAWDTREQIRIDAATGTTERCSCSALALSHSPSPSPSPSQHAMGVRMALRS
jgi:hypothetical protein